MLRCVCLAQQPVNRMFLASYMICGMFSSSIFHIIIFKCPSSPLYCLCQQCGSEHVVAVFQLLSSPRLECRGLGRQELGEGGG